MTKIEDISEILSQEKEQFLKFGLTSTTQLWTKVGESNDLVDLSNQIGIPIDRLVEILVIVGNSESTQIPKKNDVSLLWALVGIILLMSTLSLFARLTLSIFSLPNNEVFIADKDIPAFSLITNQDVISTTVSIWQSQEQLKSSINDKNDLVGKITIASIPKGNVIKEHDILDEALDSTLSYELVSFNVNLGNLHEGLTPGQTISLYFGGSSQGDQPKESVLISEVILLETIVDLNENSIIVAIPSEKIDLLKKISLDQNLVVIKSIN